MGADYSFYMKTIDTHAHTFFKVIIFSIGSVSGLSKNLNLSQSLCVETGFTWTFLGKQNETEEE